MFRIRRRSLVIALCLSVLPLLDAWAGEPSLTVARLVARLAQSGGSSVRFSEERRLQHLTAPLFAEGTLTFEPPGTLERLVLQPKWEKMVAEGGLLTIQTNKRDLPARFLLSDYPTLDAMTTTLRSLFAGDVHVLQRLHEVMLACEGDAWLLTLIPRVAAWSEAIREVQVAGSGRSVRSITVTEAGGDILVITILGKP